MVQQTDLPIAFELDGERFPALLQASKGDAAVAAELRRLVDELRPPRSVRKPQKVLAKILRNLSGNQVEETVVVREVSATGIVVELAQHTELDLLEACRLTFWLRAQGSDADQHLELTGTLVRLIELRRGVAVLAFRFDEPKAEERSLLYALAHWSGGQQDPTA